MMRRTRREKFMASASRIRRWAMVLAPFAAAVVVSPADAALVISTAPTSNVTCSAGNCIATASDAVLNVADLKAMLHQGNVRVGSGPANAIAAAATLSWTQASRLTLVARTAITVSQPMVVAGDGAVALTTTDDKSPGAIAFVGRGRLDFWNLKDRLIINGHDYTLAGDVAGLASAIAANTHGYFALAKDYDAKGDAPYTTSPVYVLYGSLNGLGHTISNVKIQAAQGCAGFIAYFVGGSASSVSNLILSQIDATQTANSDGKAPNGVGGLAGCSQGTISHVRVTGHVSGPVAVSAGGIVGWQAAGADGTGPVSDSSVNVVVSGGTNAVAGGIVGYDLYGSLLRCAAAGRIAGPYAGGLVGLAEWDFGNIVGSWSSAHVIGSLSGGLVGYADGDFTLADNYASGAVSSGGGLIGKNTGIGGTSGNSILRSYATGVVRGGGVTGIDDGTGVYASAYWDMDTTHVRNPAEGVYNIPNAPGVTGLSDAQLKSGLPAGFDPSVWGQSAGINNGYPYLLANPPQ
jgi:hypothetical protein